MAKESFGIRLCRILLRLEDGLLVLLLTGVIGMACVQILLRNLFGTGVIWGDLMVRILVLWIGLIGAMVATRQGKHIHIDVITRFLPPRTKLGVDCAVEFFAAAVCLIVALYSLKLVRIEFVFGSTAFDHVPTWLCQTIIPLAFGVMAVRFLVFAVLKFFKLLKYRP
jgi:TRAP-type C4-dicarboxylate transport system permease small subunit